ncbi:MAG TPA: hypothetical protein PK836_07730 [Syntrophales bacterium]|nr:hypothetical protein [Syntrophales bacterium]HOM07966.1 hypothetical protein [Syntrophales bacterium]HOO00612.1 hypothetical protein [Syntrophales bacterium]HPC01557.1 hypothetical protein [Syntrophales bacterium]HPQ06644.1 hypothetical protein [Syntrophales bacterium]
MDGVQDMMKRNQDLAEGFRRVEMRLMAAGDVPALFEAWVEGMGDVFAIPFLWFTIIDEPANEDLAVALSGIRTLRDRLRLLPREVFESLIPAGKEPVLASGDLRPFFRLMPKKNKYLLRSVAAAPIYLPNRVIGSLNHGDSVPGRYTPEMDTTLLKALARRFSFHLSDLLLSF